MILGPKAIGLLNTKAIVEWHGAAGSSKRSTQSHRSAQSSCSTVPGFDGEPDLPGHSMMTCTAPVAHDGQCSATCASGWGFGDTFMSSGYVKCVNGAWFAAQQQALRGTYAPLMLPCSTLALTRLLVR